jgi:sarcosine oxidase
MVGRPDSEVILGTLESCKQHALAHEVLSSEEIKKRFPIFRPSSDEIGIFELDAGYLVPEQVILSYINMARHYSADLRFNESMLCYKQITIQLPNGTEDRLIEVTTTKETYRSRKIVLAVGAWAPKIYGSEISLSLHAERRALFWLKPTGLNEVFQVCEILYDVLIIP